MEHRGFTLIELILVIAILGILAVVVLILINPIQMLSRSKDAGRKSTITQLGRSIQAYYTNNANTYPDPSQWDQIIVNSSDIRSFPSGINYYTVNNVTACQTNAKPDSLPSFCYDLDMVDQNGAIIFTKLEAQLERDKCTGNGDTYFVYSTADSRAGTICSLVDPTPWPSGSQTYIQ